MEKSIDNNRLKHLIISPESLCVDCVKPNKVIVWYDIPQSGKIFEAPEQRHFVTRHYKGNLTFSSPNHSLVPLHDDKDHFRQEILVEVLV